MRSLMLHAPAAYIASVCSSGYGLQSLTHLTHAVELFNILSWIHLATMRPRANEGEMQFIAITCCEMCLQIPAAWLTFLSSSK
eukprot:Em0001g3680a